MDLQFTPEQQAFQREVRGWLAQNLDHPFSETCAIPQNDADALVEIRRGFQRKLNDAGYLGMGWPEAWGGRGATAVEEAILRADLAAAGAPPSPNSLGIGLCAPGADPPRHRGAVPALPAGDALLRRDLVSGLQRARAPARTSRASAPGPCPTATTSASPARRSGPPSAPGRTGSSCWPAPTWRTATAASPSS